MSREGRAHVHVSIGTGAHRFPEAWREGDVVRTRLVLFNLLPAWCHELRVARVEEPAREIYSNESDALVPVWNHRIKVEEISPSRSRYTDELEIDAGILTPLIWLYAHVFYRYRQRRWRTLARSLVHDGPGPDAADSHSPLSLTRRDRHRSEPEWSLNWIKRFNRRLLNPLVLKFAGHRERPYSVARHRGRRSGKQYKTPVVAMSTRDGFIIPLPYGLQTDWLPNAGRRPEAYGEALAEPAGALMLSSIREGTV